jgi:cytochrome c biogenesis protein CcdA
VTSVLPAILALAAVDAVNPTSIAASIYLAGSRQMARLRMFTVGVYCTYLTIGLALTLGLAAALRSALADASTQFGAIVDVGAGSLLVGIGIRTWRQRRAAHGPAANAPPVSRRSGLALGFLATLADLPTAGPLLAAAALLAESGASIWAKVADLSLYNAVYISPLLAVALAGWRAARTAEALAARRHSLLACAPAVAGVCLATGAVVGAHGIASLA